MLMLCAPVQKRFELKFGDWFAEQRKSHNISQRKLADKIGISSATVSDLESGKTDGSPEMIVTLSNALEIDPANALRMWVEWKVQGATVAGSNALYVTDPDAVTLVRAYEGVPESRKKPSQELAISAFELAKQIGREEIAGGTRADHNENPSEEHSN